MIITFEKRGVAGAAGYYAPNKDPDAVLDYTINWAAWLGADTIFASEWEIPDGLTAGADSFDDTTATIWISGGTVGETYTLQNRISTDGGRHQNQSFKILIQER